MLKAEIGVTQTEAAETIRERMQRAAEKTTGEVLPEGRPNKLDNLSSLPQSQRAKENGVSYQTQRKLDALAKHPALHAKVKAGQLTVHAAAIQAGIVKKTLTIPAQPAAAARAILRHFTKEDIRTLIKVRHFESTNCRLWKAKTIQPVLTTF